MLIIRLHLLTNIYWLPLLCQVYFECLGYIHEQKYKWPLPLGVCILSKAEKAMAPHSSTLAWKIPWTEEPGRLQSMRSLSRTRLSDFTFTLHFHALEKEMATHSSVLAWRIPGTGEPVGLPSMRSHRVGHDWSDLAAAAAAASFWGVPHISGIESSRPFKLSYKGWAIRP